MSWLKEFCWINRQISKTVFNKNCISKLRLHTVQLMNAQYSEDCFAACSIFRQLHYCMFYFQMSILFYNQYSANSTAMCSIFRQFLCSMPNIQLIALMYDVCSIFRWYCFAACSIFRWYCFAAGSIFRWYCFAACSIFRWSYCRIFNIRMIVLVHALLNIQMIVLLCWWRA